MLIGVACSDHGVAIFAKIMKTIFNMLLIIGPIICIVALGYYLIMVIKSPDADQKKVYFKNIKNSFFALLIVVMLPVIVNVVMGLTLMEDSFEIAACWGEVDNAKLAVTSDYFDDEEVDPDKVNTFIINPDDYAGKGVDGNPGGDGTESFSGTGGSVDTETLFKACEAQAEWMKNYTYSWEKNPTVAKSKKRGTCVTYVACVLQRIGALKPGESIWHNGRGFGTGKVTGATGSMTVKYMNNRTFTALKSELQAGDVMLVDDNKSGIKGTGGHVFIFTGKWAKNGNPIIYDNHSAERVRKGKSAQREYSKSHKVLAVVRLSK